MDPSQGQNKGGRTAGEKVAKKAEYSRAVGLEWEITVSNFMTTISKHGRQARNTAYPRDTCLILKPVAGSVASFDFLVSQITG